MRYDLESMLPINAFSPRGGRSVFARGMTLEGGKGGGGSAPAPDPNIGIAQLEMSKISREYLESWKTEIWPTMKEQAEKQDVRADEQFALDKEIQQKQIVSADKTMAEFERNAPNREAIYREAEQYNTAENKERLASEAIGDIKTSFGVQAADLERRNQSFGINPSSGRSMATQNANSVMQAATEGAAATRARNAAEQLGWAKKMDAIALSQGQFGNQATSTGLALNAGNQALQSGQVTMGNYGALGSSMNQANMGAMQGWNNVGQLGVQKYQADVSAYSAQQQANAASSAGFGSALGSIAGMGMKAYMSDIRTKENIEYIGELPNGLGLYEYEYKPEFKNSKYAGHGRFRGVMAHEVEKVIPDAVITLSDGYKAIDYSKVN
ncbi:Intramolecular chaperone auto-processing domain containing protein [uncultured Caudovirales phage]|uniref:Intramolecular chaperone auto-processing domain containing protein n=1 Tax=uncultured Caudovirales phage TaxID=2100421 RepID=A0A6J5LR10_9CAUD|nr:Intramolecular chaperone auto-processing domain containing protein [uncultured Caudovirales phage]